MDYKDLGKIKHTCQHQSRLFPCSLDQSPRVLYWHPKFLLWVVSDGP